MSADVVAAEAGRAAERRVRPLLWSTALSVTGDGALLTAAPLLAAAMTRQALAVSAITAASYIPWIAVGLPAGALVDRWPRRRTLLAADLFRAALLATVTLLVLLGRMSVPELIIAVATATVAQCFADPAAQAVIPAIVGRNRAALTRVNGQYWAVDTVGRALLGPPLGSVGFAVARFVPFLADAISFVASASLVRRLPQVPAGGPAPASMGSAIAGGLRQLLRNGELRAVTLATGAYNFAYIASEAILVLYARQVLGLPAAAYGLLLAAGAIGGTAAGWRTDRLTGRLSYRQAASIGAVAQAAAWAATAVTGSIGVAVAGMVVSGAGSTLLSVAGGSACQALTDDATIGRVSSGYRVVAIGSAGLGGLAGGTVAAAAGLTATLYCSAAVAALTALATWPWARRRGRQVRHDD